MTRPSFEFYGRCTWKFAVIGGCDAASLGVSNVKSTHVRGSTNAIMNADDRVVAIRNFPGT